MAQTDIKKEQERLEVILINMVGHIVKIMDILPLGCGLLVRYKDYDRTIKEYIAEYDEIGKYYKQQLEDEEMWSA